jgi:prepilin-type N-terminal cleavage/methylation domain-containing protein
MYSFSSPLTGEGTKGWGFKKKFHSIPSPLGRGLGWGFTLVELIVVVTILAILWTIAFISLQWYTQEARDSKRISDVRSLISKITIENAKWISYSEIMNENWEDTSLTINWTSQTGTQNKDDLINWELLKENKENFVDPLTKSPYPFAYAIWNSNWQWYDFMQLAYVSEKTGLTKLVWNYYKMNEEEDSPSLFVWCIANENTEIEENWCPIYDVWVPYTPPPASCASYIEWNWTFTEWTPVKANTKWQTTNPSGPCYVVCDGIYVWDKWSSSCKDISWVTYEWNDIIVRGNWKEYRIYNRNAWATTVYDPNIHTFWSEFANRNETVNAWAWWIYQWWEKDDSSINGFVTWTPAHWNSDDWWVTETNKFTATYANSTPTNRTKMKWPCETWYHIPTTLEWRGLIEAWFTLKWWQTCPLQDESTDYYCGFSAGNATTLANFQRDLKLPMAGYKGARYATSMRNQGYVGQYWSSSPSGTKGFYMYFYNGLVYPVYEIEPANGLPIRCFKDIP